jgi:hypothetical protein
MRQWMTGIAVDVCLGLNTVTEYVAEEHEDGEECSGVAAQ